MITRPLTNDDIVVSADPDCGRELLLNLISCFFGSPLPQKEDYQKPAWATSYIEYPILPPTRSSLSSIDHDVIYGKDEEKKDESDDAAEPPVQKVCRVFVTNFSPKALSQYTDMNCPKVLVLFRDPVDLRYSWAVKGAGDRESLKQKVADKAVNKRLEDEENEIRHGYETRFVEWYNVSTKPLKKFVRLMFLEQILSDPVTTLANLASFLRIEHDEYRIIDRTQEVISNIRAGENFKYGVGYLSLEESTIANIKNVWLRKVAMKLSGAFNFGCFYEMVTNEEFPFSYAVIERLTPEPLSEKNRKKSWKKSITGIKHKLKKTFGKKSKDNEPYVNSSYFSNIHSDLQPWDTYSVASSMSRNNSMYSGMSSRSRISKFSGISKSSRFSSFSKRSRFSKRFSTRSTKGKSMPPKRMSGRFRFDDNEEDVDYSLIGTRLHPIISRTSEVERILASEDGVKGDKENFISNSSDVSDHEGNEAKEHKHFEEKPRRRKSRRSSRRKSHASDSSDKGESVRGSRRSLRSVKSSNSHRTPIDEGVQVHKSSRRKSSSSRSSKSHRNSIDEDVQVHKSSRRKSSSSRSSKSHRNSIDEDVQVHKSSRRKSSSSRSSKSHRKSLDDNPYSKENSNNKDDELTKEELELLHNEIGPPPEPMDAFAENDIMRKKTLSLPRKFSTHFESDVNSVPSSVKRHSFASFSSVDIIEPEKTVTFIPPPPPPLAENDDEQDNKSGSDDDSSIEGEFNSPGEIVIDDTADMVDEVTKLTMEMDDLITKYGVFEQKETESVGSASHYININEEEEKGDSDNGTIEPEESEELDEELIKLNKIADNKFSDLSTDEVLSLATEFTKELKSAGLMS